MEKDKLAKRTLTWPTIQRLSEYLIILEQYIESDREVISSSELAEIYSNTASQVRQDIFRLPKTGRVGHGYNVQELATTIRQVLGLNTPTPLIILGCGKMGITLAQHVPFSLYGMNLVGIFDNDKKIIGTTVDDKTIKDISELEAIIDKEDVKLACLCVPASAGQELTDRIVKAGINSILNFTRTRLKVPQHVFVQHRQVICSFMQLAHMSRIKAIEMEGENEIH